MLRRISALRFTAGVALFVCFFSAGLLTAQAVQHPCRPGDCYDGAGRNGWCSAAQAANASSAAACYADRPTAGVSLWPESVSGLLRAFPLLMNAMQCHIQCAMVFCEMPARLKLPKARNTVAVGAVVLVMVLYIPTGIAGYARFGGATQGDILKNFNVKDGLADVARACIAITALASFPMQHFPARAVRDPLAPPAAAAAAPSLASATSPGEAERRRTRRTRPHPTVDRA